MARTRTEFCGGRAAAVWIDLQPSAAGRRQPEVVDGRAGTAPIWQAIFNLDARHFGLRYQTTGINEDFVAGSGFTSRPGVITTNLTHRVTWFGAERAALQSWRVSALSERNRLRIDALFPYQPTPGTVFFAGYSSFLTEPPGLQIGNLRRTNDGFFLKASYLFRL